MKRFIKISRSIILSFLVINQFYFSLFASDKTEEKNTSIPDGTYFESGFSIYEGKANLNNKLPAYKNLLTTENFSSEKFYSIVLSIAKETGFLFFINSEKNPNSLISIIAQQTVPRSPPLS